MKYLYLVATILIFAMSASFYYDVLNTSPSEVEMQETADLSDKKSNQLYIHPTHKIETQVLGVKTESLEYLLEEIIRCESGGRNVCNKEYGCNAGQGILQIIPTTVKTCEQALGRSINPFNEKDSRDCAWYLLTKTSQKWHHWGYPNTWWGSYSCWQHAIPR